MHHIALIGAGQLGSRHLQGLARLARRCDITVVDPSEASLAVARQRFEEMPPNEAIRGIRFVSSMNELPSELDYVVVATAADVRLPVLKGLLAHASVRCLLLEKVLFQRLGEYGEASALLNEHGVRAWVNCPRRAFPFYLGVREFFASAPMRHMQVIGGGWGLGCNSVHFLDLMGMLTGEAPSALSMEGLDQSLIPSKRAGFVEFTGTLRGRFGRSGFDLASLADSSARLLLTLRSDSRTCVVDETAGRAFFLDQAAGGGWHEQTFRMPLMSEFATSIAERILGHGECPLASFEQSVAYHLPLVAALAAHAHNVQGSPSDFCPIT